MTDQATSNTEKSASTFRRLHDPGEFLVIPNAWDVASAALFAASGARAIATTSCGVAWSYGYPEGERLPLDLLVDLIARTTRVVSIPVSVDFERGYGRTAHDVGEAVSRLLDAGAVGINLEDDAGPPEEIVARIRAARTVADRHGVDLFINARTDVVLHRAVPEARYVEESLVRAKMFAEAGADGFFVPGLYVPEQIEAVVRGTSLPLNLVPIVPQVPDVATLRRLGVRRLSVGGRITEVAFSAARRACVELLEKGTYSSFFPGDISYDGMNALFDKS